MRCMLSTLQSIFVWSIRTITQIIGELNGSLALKYWTYKDLPLS
jgi:hypothetical protein